MEPNIYFVGTPCMENTRVTSMIRTKTRVYDVIVTSSRYPTNTETYMRRLMYIILIDL